MRQVSWDTHEQRTGEQRTDRDSIYQSSFQCKPEYSSEVIDSM